MPSLSNPKHERYAQCLAKGMTATEAMAEAGYSDPRNSTRLTKNDEIARRIAELQERAAIKTEITMERIAEMLLEDREFARQNGQGAAAVSATEKLGKLYGHFVERRENVNINHDVSDEPASESEWAERVSSH